MLHKACIEALQWPAIGGQICKLCVNVSAVQFQRSDLVGMIRSCLERSGLPAAGLEVEITENALIGDKGNAKQVLQQIRDLGVAIAIDDFGTGYSSLSYLQEFPMTRLKVDRAFVKDLEGNPDAQRITKTIIDLGKSMGLNVIAEGVETEAQKSFLRLHACDDLQGFLYSPPISAVQAASMLQGFMASRLDGATVDIAHGVSHGAPRHVAGT